MILHLLTDEKFTDYVIRQFSGNEMLSEFVLIPSNDSMGLVSEKAKCRIVHFGTPAFDDLLSRLSFYSGIVLHGLFWGHWQIPVLRAVPDHVKVAWVCWGGELYSCKENEFVFREPITKAALRLRGFLKKPSTYNWEVPKALFQRIDICTTSIDEEYDYAVSFLKNNMRHVWYTYYSIEDTVGQLISERCVGNNVWLGNSASECNNHLDVMFRLVRLRYRSSMKDVSLLTPLSYGLPWVRNMVVSIGRMLFGKHFKPLLDFVPRQEYNSLMLSCSTMIIGATEPLAQGNIITALWLGLRVYLSEKSLSYLFFKRIGAVVFSLERDMPVYKFTSLTEEDVKRNRDVLSSLYGKEHVRQGACNLIRALS